MCGYNNNNNNNPNDDNDDDDDDVKFYEGQPFLKSKFWIIYKLILKENY